jgi:hypothetical protein
MQRQVSELRWDRTEEAAWTPDGLPQDMYSRHMVGQSPGRVDDSQQLLYPQPKQKF